MKNKIGWCNTTWNPVWGCLNHCEYCYARRMAKFRYKRMIEIEINHYWKKHPTWAWNGDHLSGLKDFKPTFLEAQFDRKFPQKTQKVFVGSMSEIYYWKDEWVEKVIGKVRQYPQHIFMFLTQHPVVYARYLFPPNSWYGVTITGNKPIQRIGCIPKRGVRFLSIEPILEKIDIENIDDFEPDWVIVGAETGNRKGKIIPKKEWVEIIIDFCNRCNRPLYIKDNIVKYYPEYGNIKEFPNYK